MTMKKKEEEEKDKRGVEQEELLKEGMPVIGNPLIMGLSLQ